MARPSNEIRFKVENGSTFLQIDSMYWLGVQNGLIFLAREFDDKGTVTRSDVSAPAGDLNLFLMLFRVQQIATHVTDSQLREWALELGLAS